MEQQFPMIVVHPKDKSTKALSLIYEELENVTFFDSYEQKHEFIEAIKAAPKDEPVLLLGHGSPWGLYDMRIGVIIDDIDAEILKDRPNLVCIWCYASDYAMKHSLKGFFSGMFISEYGEALDNGVRATDEEIENGAWDFSGRFGDMMRKGIPLEEIAKELCDPRHRTSELTSFNYSRLIYRKEGNEPAPFTWFNWSEDKEDEFPDHFHEDYPIEIEENDG